MAENKDMTPETTEDRAMRFMETRETMGRVVPHAVDFPDVEEDEADKDE